MSSVRVAKKAYKAAKKSGDEGATAYTKAVLTGARGARKEAVKTERKATAALQAKGYGGGRGKAVKAARSELRSNYAGTWKGIQAKRAAAREDKGGFLSKVVGAFKKTLPTASNIKKAGKTMAKVTRKTATGGVK